MNNLFLGEILDRLRWGRGERNGSIVKGEWKILSLTEAALLLFYLGWRIFYLLFVRVSLAELYFPILTVISLLAFNTGPIEHYT